MKKLLLFMTIISSFAFANETEKKSAKQYGIGFEFSGLTTGLSITKDLNSKAKAQAVIDVIGDRLEFLGKYRYDFKQYAKYDLYGYGALGVSYEDDRDDFAPILGAGVGVEANSSLIAPGFNDIDINLELGVGYEKDYGGYWSGGRYHEDDDFDLEFTVSLGLHYRF